MRRLWAWLWKWLQRIALTALAAVAAFVTIYAVSVFLRYPLDRERTQALARAPELTARISPSEQRSMAYYAQHPFNADTEIGMWVEYDDIDPMLIDAVLHSEDQHFFNPLHFGFNPVACVGIAASAVVQFVESWTGSRTAPVDLRGCSGIEQQTAKQLFAGREDTIIRKLDELFIAMWMSANFSREDILEMYLNVSFFGNGTRGVEAAARYYYGYSFKRERKQDVAFTPLMAASLAMTLKAPSNYNPAQPISLKLAQNLVDRMHRRRLVADDDWEAAMGARKLPITRGKKGVVMPRHSVDVRDLAIAQLVERDISVPDSNGVMRVSLFHDSESQLYVEEALARHPELAKAGYQLSVYVVDNRTGGVEALINPVQDLYPASLVKPFVALCLIAQGADGESIVFDEPIGNPPVRNSDRQYDGEMRLVDALRRSKNTPFVAAVDYFGRGCVNDATEALGGVGFMPQGEARVIALGGKRVPVEDFLQSYVALATCGRIAEPPSYFREVRFGNRSLYRDRRSTTVADVAAREAAEETLHMMQAVTRKGSTASGLVWGNVEVAAKTGTAQENRQVSIVTITAYYTVLITAHARPADIREPLSGGDLVPLAKQINANLHLRFDEDPLPLNCPALPNEVKTVIAGAPGGEVPRRQ